MKKTIYVEDFIQAFKDMNRYDQFGTRALRALFWHFEDLEDSCGEEFELDVIAICCDYALIYTRDLVCQYNIPLSDEDNEEQVTEDVCHWLEENGHGWIEVINRGGDAYVLFNGCF